MFRNGPQNGKIGDFEWFSKMLWDNVFQHDINIQAHGINIQAHGINIQAHGINIQAHGVKITQFIENINHISKIG